MFRPNPHPGLPTGPVIHDGQRQILPSYLDDFQAVAAAAAWLQLLRPMSNSTSLGASTAVKLKVPVHVSPPDASFASALQKLAIQQQLLQQQQQQQQQSSIQSSSVHDGSLFIDGNYAAPAWKTSPIPTRVISSTERRRRAATRVDETCNKRRHFRSRDIDQTRTAPVAVERRDSAKKRRDERSRSSTPANYQETSSIPSASNSYEDAGKKLMLASRKLDRIVASCGEDNYEADKDVAATCEQMRNSAATAASLPQSTSSPSSSLGTTQSTSTWPSVLCSNGTPATNAAAQHANSSMVRTRNISDVSSAGNAAKIRFHRPFEGDERKKEHDSDNAFSSVFRDPRRVGDDAVAIDCSDRRTSADVSCSGVEAASCEGDEKKPTSTTHTPSTAGVGTSCWPSPKFLLTADDDWHVTSSSLTDPTAAVDAGDDDDDDDDDDDATLSEISTSSAVPWPGVDGLIVAYQRQRTEMSAEQCFLAARLEDLKRSHSRLTELSQQLDDRHKVLCSEVLELKRQKEINHRKLQSLSVILNVQYQHIGNN